MHYAIGIFLRPLIENVLQKLGITVGHQQQHMTSNAITLAVLGFIFFKSFVFGEANNPSFLVIFYDSLRH